MYGRLLKLPYWSCLGASEQDPEVKAEIDDWWEEMAADPHDRGRLFAYLQMQMKAQGVYDGEINGRVDPALLRAVRAYRVALGQPDDLNLDSTFLRKYLAADHAEVRKIAATKLDGIALLEGPLPAPTPAPTASTATPPNVPPVAAAPTAGPTPEQVSTPARQPVAAHDRDRYTARSARTASAAPAAPQESMPPPRRFHPCQRPLRPPLRRGW